VDQRKLLVRDAYDAVADEWGSVRRSGGIGAREQAWIERFITALPGGARVLDLG
jgi:hypothetical protein